MIQNDLFMQTMQNPAGGNTTLVTGTAAGTQSAAAGLNNAFAAVIAQMLGGMTLPEGTATGQQTTAQPSGGLAQTESLQMGQILQVQQLQASDLQMLQGIGQTLSKSTDAEQMTAGEELLSLVQQMQAAGETIPTTDGAQQGKAAGQNAADLLLQQTEQAGENADTVISAAGKLMQVLSEADTATADSKTDGKRTDNQTTDTALSADLLGVLSGMLWQPVAVQQQTANSGTQTGAAVTTAAVGAAQTQSVQAFSGQAAADLLASTEEAVQTPAKPQVSVQQSSVQGQSSVPQGETAQVQSTSDTANSQQQLFQLQSGFRDAVAKTRDQLQVSAKDTKDSTPQLDADTLQAQMTTGRDLTLRFTAASVQDAGQTQQSASVATQIQTGVTENLQLGKSEFTIKLNPENLGEITVKLTEHDGKTTLQLFTASAETARVINSDLNALREAVRPMAVEVHEAVTQATQSSTNANAQGFDLGSQLAQQQQHQQHQQWTAREQSGIEYADFLAQSDSDSAETAQTLDTSGLDTYV